MSLSDGPAIMMRSLFVLSLLTWAALAQDIYEQGPYDVIYKDYSKDGEEGSPQNVGIYMPDIPGTTVPLLYFESGFGGIIPQNFYHDWLERLASHGFGVMAPWFISLDSELLYSAGPIRDQLAWAEDNVNDLLEAEGVSADSGIDFDSIFFIAHSSGAHSLVEYLNEECTSRVLATLMVRQL